MAFGRANTRSAFLMTRFALPYLQKTHGCIVSAGSEAGLIGIAQNAPYGATKGWMHAFMRGVAVEQAKYGVRANCVCPGAVDTAWTNKVGKETPGDLREEPAGELHDLAHTHEGLELMPASVSRR